MSRAVRAHLPRPSVRLAGVMAIPQSSTSLPPEAPLPVPSPWHFEQFASNSSRPCVTASRVGGGSAGRGIRGTGCNSARTPVGHAPRRRLIVRTPATHRARVRPQGERLRSPWVVWLTCALLSEEEMTPDPQLLMRRVRARCDLLDRLAPVRELQQPREAGGQLERMAHADELEVLVAVVVRAPRDSLTLVANDLEPAVKHERELGHVFELQQRGVVFGVLGRRGYERAVVPPRQAHDRDTEGKHVRPQPQLDVAAKPPLPLQVRGVGTDR